MCTPWINPYVGAVRQAPFGGAVLRSLISHASVASNGANAIVGSIGANCVRMPTTLQLESAWWEPTGADDAAANTLSYRTVTLLNCGKTGVGATVLATLNLTASLGSNQTRAMVLAADPIVQAGDIIAFQHATVGGAHSDGTVLVAGQMQGNWRPI